MAGIPFANEREAEDKREGKAQEKTAGTGFANEREARERIAATDFAKERGTHKARKREVMLQTNAKQHAVSEAWQQEDVACTVPADWAM